jgi:hypothetical protein
MLVPFGDGPALGRAIADALGKSWDRGKIIAYARENSWDDRVAAMVEEFRLIAGEDRGRETLSVEGKAGATR